jgi:hypothetical protein
MVDLEDRGRLENLIKFEYCTIKMSSEIKEIYLWKAGNLYYERTELRKHEPFLHAGIQFTSAV